MKQISIDVDQSVNAAYIALSNGPVAKTVQLSESVMVDLDEFGVAVGIELLDQRAPLPLAELSERYHVRSEVMDLLRELQTNGEPLVIFTSGSEGSVSRGSGTSTVTGA